MKKFHLNENIWRIIATTVWLSFLGVTVLLYYVHHYLPEGPKIPTGDIVCQNDGRGPCGESYVEEVRDLDIPGWAKFFKKSQGELLWMALLFVGIVVSGRKEN